MQHNVKCMEVNISNLFFYFRCVFNYYKYIFVNTFAYLFTYVYVYGCISNKESTRKKTQNKMRIADEIRFSLMNDLKKR